MRGWYDDGERGVVGEFNMGKYGIGQIPLPLQREHESNSTNLILDTLHLVFFELTLLSISIAWN